MDVRKELPLNSVLVLGTTECHVEGVMGKGSCAIMYKAWYSDNIITDAKHHILVKELFPFDIKGGIYRDRDNTLVITPQAKNHYDLYKKSFERGNQVHLNILEHFPEKNGVNINTYSCNNTLYTVLGYSGGRDLETELLVNPETTLLMLADRFIGVLSALDEFHKSGYLHLDISPDNILLTGKGNDERVTLIDYNSVLSKDEVLGDGELFYSFKKGYTAPELRSGMRSKISPATDLYSVAATFFKTISSRTLTEFEMLRKLPPDISECGCIQNQPESVKSLVKKILLKGLSHLPEKRYISVSDMKKDFEELKERILGIGITHWSLWESGKKTVQEIVHNNTSFHFLKEQKNIYNLNVKTGDEIQSSKVFLADILKGDSSAVLIGDGGMGKTTSMLNTAYNANSKYASATPAIAYISLYGAAPTDENYIKDKLLENLRFKADTKTFEMARHKLKQLLEREFNTSGLPAVVVLVDGFNEISDNAQFIIDEIKALSESGGIRFVITTRQYNEEFSFRKAYMVPLKDEEVEKALSDEGLLLPQSSELAELLKNPLMLSIFIETSRNSNKQLRINDKNELVGEYFSLIAKKGTENMNENEGKLWLNDVSVSFVLPSIAEEVRKKKRALNDEEVFGVVKKCYKVLTSKIVLRAFPKWIGHLNAILGGCKTAESWYDIVVRDVLWRKTGLLSKNERGQYKVFHQTIEDYLLDVNKNNTKRIKRKIFIKNTATVCVIMIVFLSACCAFTVAFPELAEKSIFVRLRAVPQEQADYLLTDMCVSYVNCGKMYETYKSLADNPSSIKEIMREFEIYEISINSENRKKNVELSKKQLWDIETLGGIMPYSFEPIAVAEGEILLDKDVTSIDAFVRYIELLPDAQANNDTEYLSALEEYMYADAAYTSLLFDYTAWQHIKEMDENSVLRKTLSDTVSLVPKMEEVRKDVTNIEQSINSYTITKYKEKRRTAYEKMEKTYGNREIIYKGK